MPRERSITSVAPSSTMANNPSWPALASEPRLRVRPYAVYNFGSFCEVSVGVPATFEDRHPRHGARERVRKRRQEQGKETEARKGHRSLHVQA